MSRTFFHPLVLGGAFVVALLLLVLTGVIVWIARPDPTPAPPATAVLNVLPAATVTQPLPTATTSPTINPDSPGTEGVTPPPPGNVFLDAYVQISGTGGDGLRLRADPGLDTEVRILGAEAEVFQVREGPMDVDDFTWWFIVGVEDESRRGWAVSNYLVVVPEP